jgi:hypothetical protein
MMDATIYALGISTGGIDPRQEIFRWFSTMEEARLACGKLIEWRSVTDTELLDDGDLVGPYGLIFTLDTGEANPRADWKILGSIRDEVKPFVLPIRRGEGP